MHRVDIESGGQQWCHGCLLVVVVIRPDVSENVPPCSLNKKKVILGFSEHTTCVYFLVYISIPLNFERNHGGLEEQCPF